MLGEVQSRLSSPSATARLLAALVLRRWAELLGDGTAASTGTLHGSGDPLANGAGGPGTARASSEPLEGVSEQLWEALALPEVSTSLDGTVVPYTEMVGPYRSLHSAAAALLNQCAASGWDLQARLLSHPFPCYGDVCSLFS